MWIQKQVSSNVLSGTGFSLWGLVFARTNPHRLKRVLLNPVPQEKA